MGDGDLREGGEDGGCHGTEQDLDIREWRETQSTETLATKSRGWRKKKKKKKKKRETKPIEIKQEKDIKTQRIV